MQPHRIVMRPGVAIELGDNYDRENMTRLVDCGLSVYGEVWSLEYESRVGADTWVETWRSVGPFLVWAPHEDYYVCRCGNEPDSEGFVPCVVTGQPADATLEITLVDPTTEAWTGGLYMCEQCGRVFDPATYDSTTQSVRAFPFQGYPRHDHRTEI